MKIPLIRFNNLPNNVLVRIENNFKKELFRNLYLKINKITKSIKNLGCCSSSFYNYKINERLIPVRILKKMTKICNISNYEIEKNINSVKKPNGKEIPIRLPFFSSKELAGLLGHTFGDGHISESGRLSYTNNRKELINNFKKLVKNVFNNLDYNINNYGDGCFKIKHPSIIGELLAICGGVKGSKVKKEFSSPKWIMNGSKEIHKSFLKALFDDEGSISKKTIRFKMTKLYTKKSSLKEFLSSLKFMLSNFNIKSSDISTSSTKIDKEGKKISYQFVITSYKNLRNFFEKIGFTHSPKSRKLNFTLRNYKRYNYP